MRTLGKVLLWVLMVVFFAALVVGGAVGYFYYTATPGDTNTAALSILAKDAGEAQQNIDLAPAGWELHTPVLGGVFWRAFGQDTPTEGQQYDWGQAEAAPLAYPLSAKTVQIDISNAGGSVFSGAPDAYGSFTYPASGRYFYRVSVEIPAAADGERPKEYGTLEYRFTLKVAVTVNAFLSDDRVKQGDVIAVRVENNLDGLQPTGSSALGPVNFIASGGGYVAFVPVAYNREMGDYTIEVQCGETKFSLPVSVEYKPYTKKQFASAEELPDAMPETAAGTKQYRDAIWPLYDTQRPTQLWQGIFQKPVDGLIRYEYGMGSLLPGATVSQRHSGIDYAATANDTLVVAPAGGEVVFAGNLALTGNTVVIEHGGGVKSYLFFLSSIAVSGGQTVEKGAQVGTLNTDKPLHYEIRIGSQSVDPAPILAGSSALYR